LLNQKRKTTGFSLRVDEESLETLRQESTRLGISVNALMNKILKDYCQNWRWAERFGIVYLTRPTLSSIITCCPDESLRLIAKTSGSTGTKDALRTMGITPTYDHITMFLEENVGKFGNWFDYNQFSRGRTKIIHLRHELGRKWSIFIAEQVSTIFETILGKTVNTELLNNAATLEITM